MNLRWLILFVTLAAPAFAEDWKLSGSATTILGGQKSRGDITFRIDASRVNGYVTIAALNRRVPFRGQVYASGKVWVKIDTRDGLHGSLTFSLASKAAGKGRIFIPGRGVARVHFHTQPLLGGADTGEYEGTWTFEASNPSGLFNKAYIEITKNVEGRLTLSGRGDSYTSQAVILPRGREGYFVFVKESFAGGLRVYNFTVNKSSPFDIGYFHISKGPSYQDTFHFVSFKPR